jgi:hypothetical protein
MQVVGLFDETGVSGSKGRKENLNWTSSLTAVTRREIDVVMAWSVDRLGAASKTS